MYMQYMYLILYVGTNFLPVIPICIYFYNDAMDRNYS